MVPCADTGDHKEHLKEATSTLKKYTSLAQEAMGVDWTWSSRL